MQLEPTLTVEKDYPDDKQSQMAATNHLNPLQTLKRQI